ncbi:hypothetical protein SAMN02746065_14018 [Desulfocicer vacuolatum DSM 3385]|uniref:Uncharacterized protein n=1 Tax=Desulfocicer vacuolatum DSM 3385 TaxID=1121400 RepID=A0A1W2ERC2_9BACT|nr:hypothetical protein SAMN02746065_14018 [Desulfocicer vacuolatum DSM 3385]
MVSVTQIKVAKHKTGLVGFEETLKDVSDMGHCLITILLLR